MYSRERGIFVVMVNQLSIEMKLLHHVIALIIVPKTEKFDFITERADVDGISYLWDCYEPAKDHVSKDVGDSQ